MVNGLIRGVSITRYFLNDTHILIYLVWCVQTLGRQDLSVAHPFYSQICLCLAISEQDFRCSVVVNKLVCGVLVPRHFLNDTNIFNIFHVMCKKLGRHTLSVAHPFYSQAYLCLVVSEQDVGRSGAVNGLFCGVLVPRYFLNNKQVFYIYHMMCANTWKTKFKSLIFFYSQTYLCLVGLG